MDAGGVLLFQGRSLYYKARNIFLCQYDDLSMPLSLILYHFITKTSVRSLIPFVRNVKLCKLLANPFDPTRILGSICHYTRIL
jgi:hypothetical protein